MRKTVEYALLDGNYDLYIFSAVCVRMKYETCSRQIEFLAAVLLQNDIVSQSGINLHRSKLPACPESVQIAENPSDNLTNAIDNGNVASRITRLKFLDGLRGLAALYIVLYHAAGDDPPPEPSLRFLAWFLQFGHYAVGVFIVLSGFCLMLPVVRSADKRLRDGFSGYLKRRMRRILPAYYGVLTITIACIAFVLLQEPILSGEEAEVLNLSPGTILSHLLMVHNLRESWAQALDPPMWTVALECQIYLLFPLLLLPIWRRFGIVAAIVCGLAIGFAPHLFLPARINLLPGSSVLHRRQWPLRAVDQRQR